MFKKGSKQLAAFEQGGPNSNAAFGLLESGTLGAKCNLEEHSQSMSEYNPIVSYHPRIAEITSFTNGAKLA